MSIDADDDGKNLSKRKLELEIAELARPIWQRPAFITPVIAAALSVILAYFSGWFDVQLTRLANRRDALERDISKFQIEKSAMQTELSAMREALQDAKTKIELADKELKASRLELATELISHTRERKELEGQIEAINRQLVAERANKQSPAVAELEAKRIEVERSLSSSKRAERKAIDRIRAVSKVDADGCFFIGEEQHCNNY